MAFFGRKVLEEHLEVGQLDTAVFYHLSRGIQITIKAGTTVESMPFCH
jgi:hypothetical protein